MKTTMAASTSAVTTTSPAETPARNDSGPLELGVQIDALGYRDVGYILGLRFLGTRTRSGSLPRPPDFEA